MRSYRLLLETLFPGINPAGIEAYIRIEEAVIRNLSLAEFVRLAEKAVSYESACPGFLDDLIGRSGAQTVH